MRNLFEHRSVDTAEDKLWRVPWLVLAVVSLLVAVGTTTLYSVAGGSMYPWAEPHALRFLALAGVVLGAALVPIRLWARLAYPLYAISLLLLALVPLVGIEALGARRWLGVAGVSMQPSEFMKVGLVLALARYYQWLPPEETSSPRRILVPLALVAAPVALTLTQPDLGTAMLLAAVGLCMMFLAGASWLYYAAGLLSAWAMMPVVWDRLRDYQKRRIEIFLDPDKDPLGAGYHITQSKIALGSGGSSGKGFMQGTQSQLDFLPEKQTDFIFTMFAEEWGFAGGVLILALYAVLLALLLAMALQASTRFGRLVIGGTAAMIFLYVFINVAMVTGLVPVVGVPLPFLSYGGTSMTTIMASLGLAMSVHVHRKERFEPGSLKALW